MTGPKREPEPPEAAAEPPRAQPNGGPPTAPIDPAVDAMRLALIEGLAPGVAHALSNPLAAILGLSELLRRDPDLSADARESAALIADEAARAERLIGTFIDFLRARTPERHATPVRPLLETVMELTACAWPSGIAWDLAVAPDLPRVVVDRAEIQLVLLGLAGTACRTALAAGPAGRVTLAAEPGPALDGRPSVRIAVGPAGVGAQATPAAATLEVVRRHGGRITTGRRPDGSEARTIVDLPA